MKKENTSKDQLEQFFKKLFKDGVKPEHWNTPPDRILENALSALDENKEKDRSYPIVLILLVGSLIGIASYFYVDYTQTKITDLENQVSKLQDKVTLRPSVESEEHSIVDIHETTESIDEQQALKNTSTAPEATKHLEAKTEISAKAPQDDSSSGDQGKTSPKQHILSKAPSDPNKLLSIAEESTVIAPSQQNRDTITAKIPTLDLLLKKEVHHRDIPNVVQLKTPRSPRQTEWAILSGAVYQAFSMKGIRPSDDSRLEGYEKFTPGWNIQLMFSKNLNKRWGVEGFIQYDWLNNSSHFQKQIDSTEIKTSALPNSDLMIDVNSKMISALQEKPMSFNYILQSMNGITPNTNTPTNMDISIEQNIRSFGLGFGGFYQLFSGQKIEATVHTGLSYRYLSDVREHLKGSYEHLGLKYLEFEESYSLDKTIRKGIWEAYAATDIRYALSDNIRLLLRVSGHLGISPMTQNNANGTVTKMKMIYTQLGVSHRF